MRKAMKNKSLIVVSLLTAVSGAAMLVTPAEARPIIQNKCEQWPQYKFLPESNDCSDRVRSLHGNYTS